MGTIAGWRGLFLVPFVTTFGFGLGDGFGCGELEIGGAAWVLPNAVAGVFVVMGEAAA
jgi:hypothetical protein